MFDQTSKIVEVEGDHVRGHHMEGHVRGHPMEGHVRGHVKRAAVNNVENREKEAVTESGEAEVEE